jgi:hypothetical protein
MHFAVRLVVGIAAAACLTAGLHFALGSDAATRPIVPVDARGIAREPGATDVRPTPLAVERGMAWLVYLAAPGTVVPDRVAPVVAILPGGTMRLERAPPAADRPADAGHWLAAGVVLPVARLDALDPGARASLLRVLEAWSAGLAFRPSRAIGLGVAFGPADVDALVRWAR